MMIVDGRRDLQTLLLRRLLKYTVNGDKLYFFEFPSPLPLGEG